MKKTITVLTSLAIFGTANAQINLISNGDFENNPFSPNLALNQTGNFMSGWTANSLGVDIIHQNHGGGWPNSTAGWLVDLGAHGGTAGSGASITSDTVSLSVGSQYILSFDYAGFNGTSPSASWSIDGNSGSLTNDGSNLWKSFSTTITATSATGSFVFTEIGDSGTTGMTIDNVSLTLAPEPSSTALLGLGTLGLLARRKR